MNRNHSTGLVLQRYNSHSCHQLPSFHWSREQLTPFSENSRSVELILVERGGPISNYMPGDMDQNQQIELHIKTYIKPMEDMQH